MIHIKIDFPAGRWHATAWGTHVNEGVPEWPPCPWRILRALLAAWHWKHHRRDEAVLRALIDKLASAAPDYLLPTASAAHTRHYMPVIEGKKETKTKIFDTFVHVNKRGEDDENESLWIRWDIALTAEEHALLGVLLASLSYMGRAESLVIATLLDSRDFFPTDGVWTIPADSAANTAPSDGNPACERIRLLMPQAVSVCSQTDVSPKNVSAKKTARGKKKTADAPATLFDALQLDNADWKKEGRNLPPGSRWMEYFRPRDCFKIAPIKAPLRHRDLPTVARFALTCKVPPSITQSLSLAERFHQALCKHLGDGNKSSSITGFDDNGFPRTDNAHAYFLPECDSHGYVTHMTLHAPCGFDENASHALGRIRKIWGMEGEGFEVEIVLLGTGRPADFQHASPYFRPSRTWISLTPFVPVRHAKATRTGIPKIDLVNGLQKGSPEHDCLRLLQLTAASLKGFGIELPVPVKVLRSGAGQETGQGIGERITTPHVLRSIHCLDFQRQRVNSGATRGDHRGFALQLEFENPVTLPFGFGYAAHFGLGLFVPVA